MPTGGRSGSRLSRRAWAKLIRPPLPSSSSSISPSPSPSGVSGRVIDGGAVFVSERRRVSKVGAGEPGTAGSGRAKDKSRFAGLLLLLDGAELMTAGRLESAGALRVALVRSSKASLPEAPAATTLIASSSLESSQFVLMTRPPAAVLGRGGVEVRTLVRESARAWTVMAASEDDGVSYGGGWPSGKGVLERRAGDRGTGGRGMRGRTGVSSEKDSGVEALRGIGL